MGEDGVAACMYVAADIHMMNTTTKECIDIAEVEGPIICKTNIAEG
jgi:hypothetical protein